MYFKLLNKALSLFSVASLNPDINNHQIAQILTEKWSRLSVEEKAIYKNMISKDYPKYVNSVI